MTQIESHHAFQQALASLSISKQRQVGGRFIENVLDLASDPRYRNATTLLARDEVSAEELIDAFHSIHALYAKTHPRSDLSELNYAKQAEHFIAEACLVCLSPTYEGVKVQRLAEKAAMYCRMARTCAEIKHDQDVPQLAQSEKMLAKEIQDQYRILGEFLTAG